MNRSLLALGITLAAALPARADLSHRISSSVQLDVHGASTRAIRVGNSYSISGSGVDTTDGSTAGVVGGLGAHTNGVAALTTVTASQSTDGNAFSFSNAYTIGDTVPTSAPTTGAVPNFGDITSTAAGDNTGLSGTISSSGAVTISPGGANTSAIGQVISELTVR
ncbi:MAG: hypothetical protein EBY40_04715 [Marivivens sp.]|nr:hypothetical protein [Marivivens sp.]NCW67413.1 hypothetical protein [Marivivens sp.]NDH02416.1 hypothetical protein [Marivivens sp.]